MWPFGDKVSKQSMSDLVVKGSGASAQSDSTDNKPEAEEDYIIHGLRQDHPDLADIDDATLYEAVRRADFDTPPDDSTYKEIMRRTYVPEEVRNPGVGKVLGEAAKKLPGQLWHGIEGGVMAPFRAEAERAGMMGQSYLGLPAGPSMEAPLNEMEKVSYNDLLKRGYSPEIAKHVMSQRIGTMQELSQGMDTAAEQGGAKAVEGTAFYGSAGPTLPLGGLPGRLATEVAMGITPIATEAMAVKGLAHAVDHAIAGGAGLSGYDMIKAAAEGKSASEIFNAGAKSFLSGAAWGVALPIVGKGIAKTLGKVASTTVEGMSAMVTGTIPRYIEMQESWAAQAQNHALHAQADNFADKFTSDKMRTDFSDISPDLPPSIQAAQIIQRVLGNDVLEVASESSIVKIADKIRSRRAATEALDALETSGSRRLPIPAEMNAQMPMMSPMQQVMPQPEPTPREAMDATLATIQQMPGMDTQSLGQQISPQPSTFPNMNDPLDEIQQAAKASTPITKMTFDAWAPSYKPEIYSGSKELPIGGPTQLQKESMVPTQGGLAPNTEPNKLLGMIPFQHDPMIEPIYGAKYPVEVPYKGSTYTQIPTEANKKATILLGQEKHPNAANKQMIVRPSDKLATTTKSLPYNPPKPNNAPKGSKEWFLNTFDDLRNGYIDMPNAKMEKKDYAGKTPTAEELQNNLAHRRNKRTTAWHQAVASFAEMATSHISDEDTANGIRDDAQKILETRDSSKPTSTEEVTFANKLLDKVITALKEGK